VVYPPQVALAGFGQPGERPWVIAGGLFLAAVRTLLQNPDELDRANP